VRAHCPLRISLCMHAMIPGQCALLSKAIAVLQFATQPRTHREGRGSTRNAARVKSGARSQTTRAHGPAASSCLDQHLWPGEGPHQKHGRLMTAKRHSRAKRKIGTETRNDKQECMAAGQGKDRHARETPSRTRHTPLCLFSSHCVRRCPACPRCRPASDSCRTAQTAAGG